MEDGWRKTRHQISSICTPLYLYFSAGAGLHLYGDARESREWATLFANFTEVVQPLYTCRNSHGLSKLDRKYSSLTLAATTAIYTPPREVRLPSATPTPRILRRAGSKTRQTPAYMPSTSGIRATKNKHRPRPTVRPAGGASFRPANAWVSLSFCSRNLSS